MFGVVQNEAPNCDLISNMATPLPKIATGIVGFDELSRGGLPRHETTLLQGGPGSGQTVFALQCLVNSARKRGERGLFVAFEESTRQIVANAAGFDWKLSALMKRKLCFIDARLAPEVVHSGEFDLSGMLAMLKAK
jgi:circadian clock protein KaiC